MTTFEGIAYMNSTKNDSVTNQIDLQFSDYRRLLSSFDEDTPISNDFQAFTSVLICAFGMFAGILQWNIILQRHFRNSLFPEKIFIHLFFDSCHLTNIIATHTIILFVYTTQTNDLPPYCPLSTFFFSLASFGSLMYLSWGAFWRHMNVYHKEFYCRYARHRISAHRIILIASTSWLIVNFPKLNFNDES
ncbi:unnamed protein product [Adineta ricciae]|uniref:Uncharacterized protein n=1 Tax=Adineta ricciae TaxID=249248 RepID=A0A814QDV8_ADIRI|nr:unnamed protein product [Adineta ricciae]CAF1503329.1 unnamed protein product [Adineta ricciae]